MSAEKVEWENPGWVVRCCEEISGKSLSLEEKVDFVVELSRRNAESGGGGPFGAAVFNCRDSKILCAGVNLVVRETCSVLHAEVTALWLAQRRLGRLDLGGYELVSSCEPCAMCMGAVIWSGVKRLVFSAVDQDAREAGFDEGDKAENWERLFEKRGIEVFGGVKRARGREVLMNYKKGGGVIY